VLVVVKQRRMERGEEWASITEEERSQMKARKKRESVTDLESMQVCLCVEKCVCCREM